MKALKFKRIIYVIVVTAIITIGTQIYRSIQNYKLNKERFVNEMQQSLDVSLEAYFADLTRSQIDLKVRSEFDSSSDKVFKGAWSTDGKAQGLKKAITYLKNRDSLREVALHELRDFTSVVISDSTLSPKMVESIKISAFASDSNSTSSDGLFSKNLEISLSDSLEQIKGFAQKVVLSLSGKEVELDSLKKYLSEELERRDIKVKHLLVLYRNKWGPLQIDMESDDNRTIVLGEERDTLYSEPSLETADFPLKVYSKNTFLSKDQKIALQFENASLAILKRGGIDLFISLLISTAVIGAMMYLYGIISEQKELAEIKNDLISNITHEFKTPIATISTAMEGISNFNQANDPEKTSKYLGISKDQLKKLNGMVEKLLETASLDSNELEISKDKVEVVSFTQQIFDKFLLLAGEKKLQFKTDLEEQWMGIDAFHMENAIANLLDNAIKYGGDRAELRLSQKGNSLLWQVEDNGGNIEKQEQARIFDKFYRIPTGNVHDVKGFGIGLYYTKTMIEKHGGDIQLEVKKGSTVFTIQLNHVES